MRYTVDDLIKEVDNIKSNGKRHQKKKSGIRRFISGILAAATVYVMVPKVKDYYASNYNPFIFNHLIASDKMQEELYEEISDKVGQDVSNKENLIVIDGIINNHNLSDEEKNVFYKSVNMLEENPYFDKSQAYQSLRNVDVFYTERGEKNSEDVVGIYFFPDNYIEIYNDGDDYHTITHEIVHCALTNSHNILLPSFLREGMTELLSNEYFSTNPFLEEHSYVFEIIMVKILCEVVGADEVLKCYSTGNLLSLENALALRLGNDNASNLLEKITRIFENYKNNGIVSKEEMNDVLYRFDQFFIDDQEGITSSAYLYYRDIFYFLATDNPYSNYGNYIVDKGVYIKPYFSKQLEEMFSDEKLVDFTTVITVDRKKVYKIGL